jgi:hypothetical protein
VFALKLSWSRYAAVRRGRNVSTNKMTGYLFLSVLARLRRRRRRALRYAIQQRHIGNRLNAVVDTAADDCEAAVALGKAFDEALADLGR